MIKQFLSLVVIVSMSASAATASLVPIISTEPESATPAASFDGSFSYDGVSLLTIVLRNTSPVDNGGFITAIAFNIDRDATATLQSASLGSWQNLAAPSASPFGDFDAGAGVGSNWTGGGTPSNGIGVGQTGTFIFEVAGADAGSLMTEDFLSKISFGSAEHSAALVVRFRGFEDGGSNKVPGVIIPLPAAVWTGLSMLGLLGGARVKRRLTPWRA